MKAIKLILLTLISFILFASGCGLLEIDDYADNAGSANSIAIDSNNHVHISYINRYTTSYLRYATNVSGSWETTTIDQGYIYRPTSIAVDSNHAVHIAYRQLTERDNSASNILKYATNASGSWVISVIDSGENVGEYAALALDGNDAAHISYHKGSYYGDGVYGLKYATNSSGSWESFTLVSSGEPGIHTALALDGSGNVHISYIDRSDPNNVKLKYINNTSGSWEISTLNSDAYFDRPTSICLDSADKAHIAYCSEHYALNYATNQSGVWVTSAISPEAAIDAYPAMAIDNLDKLHIAATKDDLLHISNSSGAWETERISAEGEVSFYAAIAADSNNYLHIAYHNYTFREGFGEETSTGDLIYVTNASGAWVNTVVDRGN